MNNYIKLSIIILLISFYILFFHKKENELQKIQNLQKQYNLNYINIRQNLIEMEKELSLFEIKKDRKTSNLISPIPKLNGKRISFKNSNLKLGLLYFHSGNPYFFMILRRIHRWRRL
jgi:hypothetical protein